MRRTIDNSLIWIGVMIRLTALARAALKYRIMRARQQVTVETQPVRSEVFMVAGNGQMLLPGITEPHRWDFMEHGVSL